MAIAGTRGGDCGSGSGAKFAGIRAIFEGISSLFSVFSGF
jgi:hypothetical protein